MTDDRIEDILQETKMTDEEKYSLVGKIAIGLWHLINAAWAVFVAVMMIAYLFGYWEIHWL